MTVRWSASCCASAHGGIMSVHVPVPKIMKYKVGQAAQISAQASIGDAQEGGWAIAFDLSSITKGSKPQTVPVGSGQKVKGEILQIIVTAVDVNPKSNWLSAKTTISGGPEGDQSLVQTFQGGTHG